MKRSSRSLTAATAVVAWAVAVGSVGCAGPAAMPRDPATARVVSVDRFSAAAGHLQVRTATNGLPAANAPVNFDQGPFVTQGLGPNGERVRYYNFDVQPTAPAPIFVLFRAGQETPVAGQLNIIDVIPGDPGYNDFWRVVRVDVPADYVANTVTSFSEITAMGYRMQTTDKLVNCPVVPDGSTATMRLNNAPAGLISGWYRGDVVKYFTFEERDLAVRANEVPRSPIYVAFAVNPDQPGGGPPSGFRTEMGAAQTHNVVATTPANAEYSPLWTVNVYDNAAFASVRDLATARAARALGAGVANVNCPIVSMQ